MNLRKRSFNQRNIHILNRYMDDTLVFWTGSLAQLEDFIQFINTLHGSLKFTYEASVQSIQFLELVIYKRKRFDEVEILDIKCHTKKTETGQFLHRSSCHPQPVFDGFLRGEIIRYAKNQQQSRHICREERFLYGETFSQRVQ